MRGKGCRTVSWFRTRRKTKNGLILDTRLHPFYRGHCPHLPIQGQPATLQTHLLQQGKGHPGRILAVSDDHSCKTVVSHVDVAQIF